MTTGITELTEKQDKILNQTVDEWFNIITKNERNLTKAICRKDIDWFYHDSGLQSPEIIISSSLEEMKSQFEEIAKTVKFKFVQQEFGSGYESWLCLYDFLEKPIFEDDQGNQNVSYTHNSKYLRYTMMMKNGIFSAVFTDTHAFLCKLPKRIRFDSNDRLHSRTKPAIDFGSETNSYYFIKGRRFDQPLWSKVTSGKMNVIDVLNIENMEQRYIVFDTFGPQKLLKESNATLIDTYRTRADNLGKTSTLKLYRIDGILESNPIKMLTYRDPSTGRPYFKFVKPEFEKADESMAWAFQMPVEEYRQLNIQA